MRCAEQRMISGLKRMGSNRLTPVGNRFCSSCRKKDDAGRSAEQFPKIWKTQLIRILQNEADHDQEEKIEETIND